MNGMGYISCIAEQWKHGHGKHKKLQLKLLCLKLLCFFGRPASSLTSRNLRMTKNGFALFMRSHVRLGLTMVQILTQPAFAVCCCTDFSLFSLFIFTFHRLSHVSHYTRMIDSYPMPPLSLRGIFCEALPRCGPDDDIAYTLSLFCAGFSCKPQPQQDRNF